MFYTAFHIFLAIADIAGAATVATVPSSSMAEGQLGQDVHDAFNEFVAKHGRVYPPHEIEMRKELFDRRWKEVQMFNYRPNRLWTAGINAFTDRTEAERKDMLGYDRTVKKILSRRGSSSSSSSSMIQMDALTEKEIPETMDWRNLTTSQNIRDQGSCGSCWAFTVISVLEAHYEIHTAATKGGSVPKFSPQQVVSCTPNPHNCGGKGGCDGATVELGFDWVLKNGLSTDEEVPYKAETGACQAPNLLTSDNGHTSHQTGSSIGMVGYHTLTSNEDLPLANAIANYGPVAVAVAANDWFMYASGVFDGCPPGGVLDHAVTAYGYGTDSGTKYWLIRNSYGSSWGENGFIRLKRFGNVPKEQQHCGMDNDPMQGVMCEGSQVNSVEVCGMCGILYDATVPYFTGSPGPYEKGVAEPAVQAYGTSGTGESSSGTGSDNKQIELTETESGSKHWPKMSRLMRFA